MIDSFLPSQDDSGGSDQDESMNLRKRKKLTLPKVRKFLNL